MLIAAHVFGPQQRSESLEVGSSDRHRWGGVCSYTAIDIAGSMHVVFSFLTTAPNAKPR